MKKNLSKKLLLNKVTIVSLDEREMRHMKGGHISAGGTCVTDCDHCTDPIYCGPIPTVSGC